MSKKVAVIGSGFASLAAACYLGRQGYSVTVYEKNPTLGGRASRLEEQGFAFDMGPTWYWMPDIFERFFTDFSSKPSDYYTLLRPDTAYRVFFGKGDYLDIEAGLDAIVQRFEALEEGSGKRLRQFIARAQTRYQIAMGDLVYRPGISPWELVSLKTLLRMGDFFSTIRQEVRRSFNHPQLIAVLEFPALFLGAKPANTPSFYSLMNYADFGLGTFYPQGGMYRVVQGIVQLAQQQGVQFMTNSTVQRIEVSPGGKATGIVVDDRHYPADIVLSGADYWHSEQLLPTPHRQYKESYWKSRVFAPSALLFYLGFNKKIDHVAHHTLFFDTDFEAHAAAIYDHPQWPKNPLFYTCFPSQIDPTTAPVGCEAATFLVPLAVGLDDTDVLREQTFDLLIKRLEELTHTSSLAKHVVYKASFGPRDFSTRYNAYEGNAYGLANTLWQTAFLRPKLHSQKIKNLFFTGQLTVPGPGVPPALISGKIAADLIIKSIR